MKKRELKDYNRLLRAENEALREILHMAADSLSDGYQCGEIKLLQEENTELAKDLNDLQADWGVDYTIYTREVRRACKKNDELIRDIRDLQADWAADHARAINQHEADCALSDMTLQEFERDIESLTEERDRFRGIIRELKKEKYDMGMELEKLKKQNARLTDDLITARKRLRDIDDSHDRQAEELDEKDRTIRDLEEQISNLKAAAVPKSKAPSYAPGYERNGGK